MIYAASPLSSSTEPPEDVLGEIEHLVYEESRAGTHEVALSLRYALRIANRMTEPVLESTLWHYRSAMEEESPADTMMWALPATEPWTAFWLHWWRPANDNLALAERSKDRDVDFYLETIRSLLLQDHTATAAAVAQTAAVLFPWSQEIVTAHEVLRHGKSRPLSSEGRDRSGEVELLGDSDRIKQYRGKWVAVLEDEIVASGPNVEDLLGALGDIAKDESPLIHFVE